MDYAESSGIMMILNHDYEGSFGIIKIVWIH